MAGMLLTPAHAGFDVEAWQRMLDAGRPEEVRQQLDQALEKSPDQPHLLYNRAVTAYAAGRFEDALIDLDRVEDSRYRSLSNQARFQKGNAEFRLGLNTRETDLEATVSYWKQSVASYERLLKDQPKHRDGRKNYERVRGLLFELLLKTAKENLKRGEPRIQPADQRIQALRRAMEQFHDAAQMEPQNQEAQQGEQQARDLLAQALAEEGTRKTMANNLVAPAPNEAPMPRPDLAQIREGVNMLEDAQSLKPEDPGIADQLQKGRHRLADALTLQAMILQSIEQRIPKPNEKQALLRMAMESLEKALDQVPEHQLAKQLLEQIKKRLAEVHEQQGDQLAQQSPPMPLEQQAQSLSQALDHFQQASELQPQQSQLPTKARQTQTRLEDVLEQLGDKLMKAPGNQESMEQEAMRLEGAAQALNELQSLKPSEKTAEKARQVGQQLGALREKMAAKGPGQQPEPEGSGPGQSQAPPQGTPEGMPVDAPPRLDTPGVRGPYRSPAMNRNLRDY